MFGKWFDSAYTGSLAGSGADVFAVWTYAIAHAWNASVELNPLVVAGLIGMPVVNVERAVEFLCQPDPRSRNPAHDGRRLIYESGYRYEVVSQPIYRNMRDEEERREYLRVKQQESRDRRKSHKIDTNQQASTDVNIRQPASTQSESESEVSDANASSSPTPRKRVSEGQKKRDKKKRNSPPTKTDEAKARHALFKAAIFKYWKSKNPEIDCPWQDMEGCQLEMWLRASPHTTLPNFVQMLRHRYQSEVVHSERPSAWIKNITSFANHPIDRYGKKLEEGNKNGKSNAQAQQARTHSAFEQARIPRLDFGGTGEDRALAGGGGDHGEDRFDGG